jgi:serine/threonine-protein kinase
MRPKMMLEGELVNRPVFVPTPTAGFAIGTVLQDTYRIVQPLAEGGCGEVYLAAHTRLPGSFAVKVLHPRLTRDREALARFQQEAEITSTLRHPHIVQVFDFNVTDTGVPYLVMELLEGVALSELVGSGAPLDPRRAVNIIDQIAQGLHAAHERGVVHRDLKPDNVMLLSAGATEDFVKVLDFGISQASWRTRLTDNDRVSGTPQYMAPEQARGLREQIDHRTDQFSLAAIAYTLFTGREAFSGDNPIAVLYQVVHNHPPTPVQVNPAIGQAISDVIVRGLSKDSADRYGNVLEFAAALRAAVDATLGAQTSVTAEVSQSQVVTAEVSQSQVVSSVETVTPEATVDAELIAADPPGRETKRLIRRIKRKNAAPRRLVALAFAAGLATFAWFHPKTRGPTRAAWGQVTGQVHQMIDRVRAR